METRRQKQTQTLTVNIASFRAYLVTILKALVGNARYIYTIWSSALLHRQTNVLLASYYKYGTYKFYRPVLLDCKSTLVRKSESSIFHVLKNKIERDFEL